MTRVIYIPERYRLGAEGHAGAGEKGSDLVCAGMTALFAAALAAMEQEEIRAEIKTDEQKGVIDIGAKPTTAQGATCRAILDTIAAGIAAMAREHPDNVSFQRFIWGED